jgi:dicarboxylate transporter 10
VTYGASRIALYEELKYSAKKSEKPVTTPMLTMMAAASGFVGALFGTTSDIANIRMQNDRSLPIQHRRNYKHVLDAWVQMKRHEGWRSFTQGLWPNCFRCGIMTASQLASYDTFKTLLRKWTSVSAESPVIHISASLLASLVATSISSPMDVIRTQLMSASKRVSVLRIVTDLTRSEGYRWVFRGWAPSFVRLGPQTIATLVALEQHKRIYRIFKCGGD